MTAELIWCHLIHLEGEAVTELDEKDVPGVDVEEVAEAIPKSEPAGPVFPADDQVRAKLEEVEVAKIGDSISISEFPAKWKNGKFIYCPRIFEWVCSLPPPIKPALDAGLKQDYDISIDPPRSEGSHEQDLPPGFF